MILMIMIMMIIISQSTLIDLRRFGYHFTIYPPLGVVHLTLPYPGGVIVSITNNKTIYIVSRYTLPPSGGCYYYYYCLLLLLLLLFVISIIKLNTIIITNNNIRVDVSRRGLIKIYNNNNNSSTSSTRSTKQKIRITISEST